MATPTTKKFSDLPAVVVPTSADVVPVQQGAVTKQLTTSMLPVSNATAQALAATGSPSFDPTLLPFAGNSPWRLGRAEGAKFAPDNDARNVSLNNTNAANSAGVNYYQYSHPIAFATTSDPLATVTDSFHAPDGVPPGGTWQEYISAAARIAAGTDRHMHVITPDKKQVIEHFGTTRTNSTTYTTTRRHAVSLYGSGIGPQDGTRAYGGSAIGGLIRVWEMDPAHPKYTGVIAHPIAIACRSIQMLYTGKVAGDGYGDAYDSTGYGLKRGYVWPATEQDYNSDTAYTGSIPMGSYFAIPSTVDITTLGLDTTAGLMVARAMQDYGAYITDTSGTTAIYLEDADVAAEGNFASQLMGGSSYTLHDIKILFQALKVVTNNGPSTPNGGTIGAPRRGLLPTTLAGGGGSTGSSTVTDATTTAKGVVQLAGDLAGTAAAPTVPGLATKAPLASPAFTGTPTVPTASAGTNTTQAASTGFVSAAITALVNGAPAALDTLQEIAAQLANDESAATALTSLVDARAIIGSRSQAAAGALVGSQRNALDGSTAAFTATLPNPSKIGQLLLVERVDTSTNNTLTIAATSTATIRGNAAATITLPAIGVAYEALLFVADSTTNWVLLAGHKPKTWLDAIYAQALETVTTATSATAITLVGNGVNDITLTGNVTLTFPSLPPTGVAKTFMLAIRQDATGARTVTWPLTVKWAGGVAPVLSTGANKIDVLTFTSIDATTWLGFLASADMR